MDFVCNICGARNTGVGDFRREVENCSGCRSAVRTRALLAALSVELFGAVYPLAEFPVLKSVRALGLSDSESYARVLADRFYYRNTFFDRPPQLDISAPQPAESGTLDFLLAAEVFEHVRPPAEQSLRNALTLLRPHGVLLLSVPYKPQGSTDEHYPDLHDYGTVSLREGTVLVNRTASGQFQVYDNLVFHGGPGSTLELRCFSESDLRQALASAGFAFVRIHAQDYPEFGIVHTESWSLPIAARPNPPELGSAPFHELVERYRDIDQNLAKHRDWVPRLQDDLAKAHANIRLEHEVREKLQAELADRTAWALDLSHQLAAQHRELTQDLETRTNWARALESQLEERTAWAQNLDTELRARTDLARGLQAELAERTTWALQLEQEVKNLKASHDHERDTAWNRLGRRLGLQK